MKLTKLIFNSPQAHAIIMSKLKPYFNKIGYDLLPKHYYSPIPKKEDRVYLKRSKMFGLGIRPNSSFKLLKNVFKKYKNEFNSFPVYKSKNLFEYFLLNGNFMAIDGNVYYSFIRHLKPKRIVEVGSGDSTLLAIEAIKKT